MCPSIKKFNRVDRNLFFRDDRGKEHSGFTAFCLTSCVVTLNNQMIWWLKIVAATNIHDVLNGAAEDFAER